MSKTAARKAAQRAVQTMKKCEMCGVEGVKMNRHHYDYSDYTGVKILCTKCHARVHVKPQVTAICVICGKTFVAKDHRKRAKICSRECLAEYGKQCALKRWNPNGEQNQVFQELQTV
jgi:predicted RNA-binding Zn-ribbon protein involved in translation (DUF1610 family)